MKIVTEHLIRVANNLEKQIEIITYKGKNISEVLDMTVENALKFFGNIPSIRTKLQALYDVGLGYIKLGQSSTTLSGGEAQRVVLAITLCSHANLIVADEATRGIDGETKEAFWDCIRNDFSSAAMVFVTHDIAEAKRCDNVLVLKDGKVAEYGKTLDVLSNPQSEYTKTLAMASEVQDA